MATLNSQFNDAVKAGNIPEMESLVAAGADVNNREATHAPLVWAASSNKPEAVLWLLEHGAEVDGRDPASKWTPLMSAAHGGYLEVAQILMDHGANPNLADKNNKSPIAYARQQGKQAVLTLLTNSPDEVSVFFNVADRVVQEVYSFKRLERFTFVRKSDGGDVEAMQRDSFSALGDTPDLRKAFNEHKKRGGKLEEADVFPNAMQKTKLTMVR